MLVLLSCAKTMSDVSKVKVPLTTVPRFQKEASEIALQMSQFAVGDLERLLRVNAKIAVENYKRYQAFHAEETPELSALFSYTGIVFKRLESERLLCLRTRICTGTFAADIFLLRFVASAGCDSPLSSRRRCGIAGVG